MTLENVTVVYCSPYLSETIHGGSVVAKANLALFQEIFGEQVIAYSINRVPLNGTRAIDTTQNKTGTAVASFRGLCATLSPKGKIQFLQELKQLQPSIIWFDSSLLGGLIPQIRSLVPGVKIYSFFQNIEVDVVVQRIFKGALHYLPAYFASLRNERMSAVLADQVVTITQKDGYRAAALYGRKDFRILPISVQQKTTCLPSNNLVSESVIFVASDYWPNIEGLYFLNNEVAPLLKRGKILVIGKGLERYLAGKQHHRIELLGFVENLYAVFELAKVSLAPIFSGGGMKVKIAESLMMNRSVISTSFASIGYEQASRNSIHIAETAHEFAKAIEGWFPSDPDAAYKDYLNHYSSDANLKKLKNIVL